jgi:hypothetical protein
MTAKALSVMRRLGGLRLRLGTALMVAGFVAGSLGAVVGIATANPTSAAGLNVCGNSLSMAPGDSGTCSEIISDTSAPTNTSTVDVTVVIATVSTSGGGSPTATPPAATEALLDGTSTGLQVVSITDTNTGQTFSLGSVSCYTDSSMATAASYPTAAYCESTSPSELVASSVDNATFSNTFVINWSFPLAAGNPYQGSGATISVTATFTGTGGATPTPTPTTTATPTPSATATPTPSATSTPSGAVKGVSTASPTPSPSASPRKHGAVAAANTPPTTGAQLPIVLSRVLIVIGLVLIFAGLWVWRRQRYFRHS